MKKSVIHKDSNIAISFSRFSMSDSIRRIIYIANLASRAIAVQIEIMLINGSGVNRIRPINISSLRKGRWSYTFPQRRSEKMPLDKVDNIEILFRILD